MARGCLARSLVRGPPFIAMIEYHMGRKKARKTLSFAGKFSKYARSWKRRGFCPADPGHSISKIPPASRTRRREFLRSHTFSREKKYQKELSFET
jgi:hypothetical protein